MAKRINDLFEILRVTCNNRLYLFSLPIIILTGGKLCFVCFSVACIFPPMHLCIVYTYKYFAIVKSTVENQATTINVQRIVAVQKK